MRSVKYIPKVRAPKGFSFLIEDDDKFNVYIVLKDSNYRTVGDLHLDSRFNRKDQYVTHSYLNPEYHGRGWGTLLYARGIQWALEHGYSIRSSGMTSEKAQRVWRSKGIRKKFNIRTVKRGSRYDTSAVWFAFAKRVEVPASKSKKKNKGKRKAA